MTENHDGNRSIWRFFDGAVSIGISMLVAVLVTDCALCGQLPGLGWLKGLTELEDGIIIVAPLLLFPTTAALYGGFKMFFAIIPPADFGLSENLSHRMITLPC